jgi:hypothetical protein
MLLGFAEVKTRSKTPKSATRAQSYDLNFIGLNTTILKFTLVYRASSEKYNH